jgi:polysaccharide biosynthesis/export protein
MADRSSSLTAMVLAFLSLSAVSAFSTEYLIQPGDVLQVDVTGVSGMQHVAPVGPDGTIRIPLAGAVQVAGLTVHEVSGLVQSQLGSRTLRQASPSGDDYLVIIDPQQVLVSITEYRPVYLTGDVASPGEQQYRPGLTVRQAVSLAGGYDDGRARQSDMFLQTVDLRAEHAALWTEYTREKLRIERLRGELADIGALPPLEIGAVPLPRETFEELARLETEMFDLHRSDIAKERAFLESEIKNTLAQLNTVTEQQEQEREGLDADTDELQRYLDMEERGMTTNTRVTEARRSLLMSSTRYLQATAEIAQIGREEASLRRRLEQQEDERRTELLEELQEAVVRATSIEEQIAAAADKLGYTRAARVPRDGRPAEPPIIEVVRATDAGPERIEAGEDMPLMPGDVVEVSLPVAALGLEAFMQN